MHNFLRQRLKFYSIKNIRLFYLAGIFLNGWFILPNWVFFFSRYLSKVEIGIIDGVAILVGIVLEVPTGALSDLFGKKKTLIFGCICLAISSIYLVLATRFWQFLLGNVLMFIGFAFNSGSLEAFAYDSLVETGVQNGYDSVMELTGLFL